MLEKPIITWNGLSFDFDILAEESGLHEACKKLALEHIDMMFHFFCQKGYPLSLDKAAKGMALPGKPVNINGALAPRYWAEGRRQDVLNYVFQDTKTTLDLFLITEKRRQLCWRSNRNLAQTLWLPRGWLKVNKALELPLPDTSWMNDPWPRKKFTAWFSAPDRKPSQDSKGTNNEVTRYFDNGLKERTNLLDTKKHSQNGSYTYVFRKLPNCWLKFKEPTAEDNLVMSRFLTKDYFNNSESGQTKHTRPLIELAALEIALTFGGTNITLTGEPEFENNASIETIKAFVQGLPEEMVMEIWYAIGRVYPEWGPDISTENGKENDTDVSEASVGLSSYFPLDRDEDQYDDWYDN